VAAIKRLLECFARAGSLMTAPSGKQPDGLALMTVRAKNVELIMMTTAFAVSETI
jgi:hypothetical protein